MRLGRGVRVVGQGGGIRGIDMTRSGRRGGGGGERFETDESCEWKYSVRRNFGLIVASSCA